MKKYHLLRGAGHGVSNAPDLVSLNRGRVTLATFSISGCRLGSCDLAFRGDFSRKSSLLAAVRGFMRSNCLA